MASITVRNLDDDVKQPFEHPRGCEWQINGGGDAGNLDRCALAISPWSGEQIRK